ncbi:PTS sugar transporter subunit IIC [Olsenella sp. YH-ols2217]|uniref:PTS sugar transporter subunit IIC n=1 Tax=Kribbibacterium absianum TaxID=3044210 RepID=A0ABT6ZKC1_9ACTN|nr:MULTISPECIES: PTS sugar transporter subunit IIC [unclassified Olsenella]MDJ1122528.1 PTS sugar transporter subunit IIC [Olsenella sp. YH-ols2216]MDJ1129512.1 PTS sugar transporter subunit IIC [Olsenella sp. YH-ols2217]
MLQALLLAIWAGLCTWDQYGPHLGFRKPLLASVGVGVIMGDMTTAIIIGATMELMWLGVNNIGAYVPPDVISGTIVGAALGIMSGGDVASDTALAVAIGIPTATLVQQLNILVMTTNITWLHKADKVALTGDFDAVNPWFWCGAWSFFATRAIPTFIACGIGSFVIEDIMNFLENSVPWVLSGFSTAGGMMPAVGLAMLLTMMLKGNMWIFLIAGFVMSAYLGVPTMGIALVAVAVAGFYDYVSESQKKAAAQPALEASPSADDDEEYDL